MNVLHTSYLENRSAKTLKNTRLSAVLACPAVTILRSNLLSKSELPKFFQDMAYRRQQLRFLRILSLHHSFAGICDNTLENADSDSGWILSRRCHSRSKDSLEFCDKCIMHFCNCALWLQTFVCTHLPRKLDNVEDLQPGIYFWSCIHRICNITGDNHCTLCDNDMLSDTVQSLRKTFPLYTTCM